MQVTKEKSKVVVGIDFTGASDTALLEAFKWVALGAVGEVHAVCAVHEDDVPGVPGKTLLEQMETVLERAPEKLRDKVMYAASASGVHPDSVATFVHVRIGDHAKTLRQVAVDYDADLIIVGSHHRGLLERLVIGSVSEEIVRTAHCPVLVAHEKNNEGLPRTERPDPPYPPGTEPHYTIKDDQGLPMTIQRVVWPVVGDDNSPTGVRIV